MAHPRLKNFQWFPNNTNSIQTPHPQGSYDQGSDLEPCTVLRPPPTKLYDGGNIAAMLEGKQFREMKWLGNIWAI